LESLKLRVGEKDKDEIETPFQWFTSQFIFVCLWYYHRRVTVTSHDLSNCDLWIILAQDMCIFVTNVYVLVQSQLTNSPMVQDSYHLTDTYFDIANIVQLGSTFVIYILFIFMAFVD